MRTILARIGAGLCGMAAIVAINGCGDPYATVPVTGRLTLEGEAVEGAQVLFSPIDAPDKTGRPSGQPGTVG